MTLLRRSRSPLIVVAGVAAALLVAGCSDGGRDASVVSQPPPDTGVEEPLVAAFSYAVDYDTDPEVTGPTSCPLSGIRFTDESEGDPTGWEWEFADGSTSTEQNPELDDPSPGSPVTFTVTRGDESDSTTEPLTYSVC